MNTPKHSIEDVISFGKILEQTDTSHQAHQLGRAVWRIIDTLQGKGLLPPNEGSHDSHDSGFMAPVTIAPAIEAGFEFRAPHSLRDVKGAEWALSGYNCIRLLAYNSPEDILDTHQDPATETNIILKPWHYMPRPEVNRNRPYHAYLETSRADHELFGPHVEAVITTLGQIAEHYTTLPRHSD